MLEARVRYLVRSAEDPLAQDAPNVIANLKRTPKRISPVYVYDKRGTELFERQCATPEYYLRRVESRLLECHAAEITELCGTVPIVELGAGTSAKTRTLLAEYEKRGARCDYFPIDVDTQTLEESAHCLIDSFPTLFVHCLGTTYQEGLRALPPSNQARLFLFLGSSLGNMQLQEMDNLLLYLFEHGTAGEYLLLGADLDKDAAIINRAYNDSAGYGPRSTLNMLHHLNRRYRGNFVVANFRYRSQYDSRLKRNDVRIESLVAQTVTLASLGFTVPFAAAEFIDAEVMWKFDPEELAALLELAGFTLLRRWIDPLYRYGLFLLQHK
ncbi:MAG TPA: L-histidine N(alpha)-methyltransferase [Steroidobacteraceae bacterium]|jgi:dimethylhistidine N-methyltransferase|nr:L-histidine N(alpha)-methyltransferase [Steroidobacteraceae bacterium]